MAKFVDETANREKRMKEREKRREKLIREDMRQLAASEAIVAALQQQLQDQSMLPPNVRGELVSQGRPYSGDYPPWDALPLGSRHQELAMNTVLQCPWVL